MMLLYIGIFYYFPSHIKYFGSHIPKVPTKLQQLASTALNFDTVRILADFPGLEKFKFEFRYCNLVQASSKLAAEASIMIRNQEQAYLHQIKAQTQQQTFCIK